MKTKYVSNNAILSRTVPVRLTSRLSWNCEWLNFLWNSRTRVVTVFIFKEKAYQWWPWLTFNWVHTHNRWSGTTWVGWYQKNTHAHPDHRTSFINFLHLLRSIASSVFSLRAWQSSLTTSLQVLFGFPLGFGPSTSYSMHFFTQHHLFAAHAFPCWLLTEYWAQNKVSYDMQPWNEMSPKIYKRVSLITRKLILIIGNANDC